MFNLCEDYVLCKKLCDLEKAGSSCFGYELGKCMGACVNKENAVMYNLRFDLAFIKTKIRSWPFTGPVLISEGEEKFIVDKWRYKRLEEDDTEFLVNSDESFDPDTYKILSSYIHSPKNQKNIKVIKNIDLLTS